MAKNSLKSPSTNMPKITVNISPLYFGALESNESSAHCILQSNNFMLKKKMIYKIFPDYVWLENISPIMTWNDIVHGTMETVRQWERAGVPELCQWRNMKFVRKKFWWLQLQYFRKDWIESFSNWFGRRQLGGIIWGSERKGGHWDRSHCLKNGSINFPIYFKGINFIDSSPYYNNSEEVLGKGKKYHQRLFKLALKNAPVPREKYILATKLGRYPDGTFDFSAKRVIESVNDSLKKLGVDYIDVMQVHDFEFGSLDQVVKETLPALKQLKDEGKIRFIGITGFPLKIFDYVLANDKDNTVDSILSYCHCTLFNSTLLSLEPLLSEKKIGVINGGRH